MNIGDKVKFDHMGEEHTGILIHKSVVKLSGQKHVIVKVKPFKFAEAVAINITLFPERIRAFKA